MGTASFAGPQEEVLDFFNRYVTAANTYSKNLPSYYAPNAKIIRVIVKKDGSTENVVTDTAMYMKQLNLGSTIAKIRNYKNFYTNRVVIKVGNNYKLATSLNQMNFQSLPFFFFRWTLYEFNSLLGNQLISESKYV